MDTDKITRIIFDTAVASVLPGKLIRKHMRIADGTLYTAGITVDLRQTGNIYVVGAGKAGALMAKATEDILGSRITAGQVIVKYGHTCALQYCGVNEAGHPVPDENGLKATLKLMKLVEKAAENDLIICLLSGGGSSLLADLPEGATLHDLEQLNSLLLKSGASIHEINTVRKHLSGIKGGQLAQAAYPARVISLILSDVTGDSPEVIASGPTSPDPSTFGDALSVLEKYGITNAIPSVFKSHILKGIEGRIPETPKPGDRVFGKVKNLIIGNNHIALEAAKQKAEALGLETSVITYELSGSADKALHYIANMALEKQKTLHTGQKACLLFGGETTVQVTGNGLGGRNQHLALCAARLLQSSEGITILSAGTDGTDGPTDAAGAIVNNRTFKTAIQQVIDIDKYIRNFDSYNFFKKASGHIITGPTTTNVMDIIVVIVEK